MFYILMFLKYIFNTFSTVFSDVMQLRHCNMAFQPRDLHKSQQYFLSRITKTSQTLALLSVQ